MTQKRLEIPFPQFPPPSPMKPKKREILHPSPGPFPQFPPPSPIKSKKRLEAMNTSTLKVDTLKHVKRSDIPFYSHDDIMRFRRSSNMVINKFRTLGYDEKGEINPEAPFVCIRTIGDNNSATFLGQTSMSLLRIPGIYKYLKTSSSSSPIEYVSERFDCAHRRLRWKKCIPEYNDEAGC